MGADIIADEMNRFNRLVNLDVYLFEKGYAFLLAFAIITLSIDLAGAGIKSRKEIERPSPRVLVFVPVGQVLGLGRQGGVPTGARL
jgi:hypothetical protein